MNDVKRIVVFGATSGIAQACLRLWVARGAREVVLVGRTAPGLERVAADLRARGEVTATCEVLDVADAGAVDALLDRLHASGPVDVALVAFGTLPDQVALQSAPDRTREALEVNGVHQVVLAEQVLAHMVADDHGTLCVLGSVAGDRGRRSNYLYGSAKSMVTTALRGMQHRLAQDKKGKVQVVLVKPGPTETPMTAHLAGTKTKLAPVADVAEAVVDGVAAGDRVVYAPARWRVVMAVVRTIPDRVFDHLDI